MLDHDEIIEEHKGSDSGGACLGEEKLRGMVSDEARMVAAHCGHLSSAGRLREWPGHRGNPVHIHPDQRTHRDAHADLGNMAQLWEAFPDGS